MLIPVKMLAFMDGEIRPVRIPDTYAGANGEVDIRSILEAVFHYGQNEAQYVSECCSVSVGDVALADGSFHLCMPMGWQEITAEQLWAYESTERQARYTIYNNRAILNQLKFEDK